MKQQIEALAAEMRLRSDPMGGTSGRILATWADRLDQIAAQMPAWQPIETAPKDGTQFVGGFHHENYGWVWDKCRFFDEDKHGSRMVYAVMDLGGEPTHWYPAPPERPAAPDRRTE